MKNEQLFAAMGEIRDDWIADAHAHSHRRRVLRRLPVLAAALLLCMALTVSALAAADVGGVYELLYSFSPTIAQTLKPVRMSCVDQGIELELISVGIEEDSAKIYLGLRDLEGNRVDETTDLFDSYSIHMPGSSIGSCSFSHYDEASKTAAFLVEIWPDGEEITGDKLTFSLSRFISHKQDFAGILEIDPAQADTAPATQTDVLLRGYSWSDESWEKLNVDRFLIPNLHFSPMEGVQITGMGWVNGYLHIQTHYENILETDAHGYVYLVDAAGKRIEDVYSASYWDENDDASSYSEQIFNVDPDLLGEYRLFGRFSRAGSMTGGHWEITFPIS